MNKQNYEMITDLFNLSHYGYNELEELREDISEWIKLHREKR